jgi:hypothetical protein
VRGVGDDELNLERLRLALHAAGLDQTADAERAVAWRFARRDLRRGEEEHQVRLERVQHQARRDAEQCKAADDRCDTLTRGFISPFSERTLSSACLLRALNSSGSAARHAAVTRKLPQT